MITKAKYCNIIRFIKIFLRYCLKYCKAKIIRLCKLIFCIKPETKIMRNQHQKNALKEFDDNVQIKNIINNFNKYLKDYKNDGIVLSLKGHWGVGKTYFWHLYAKESLNQDKYIYISLFGINKTEEIKEKIINKISKKTNFFNKIKKFFGSSRIVGIHVSSVLSSMGIKNFKDVIICFDDFERMSPNLSMSEVLGFISELKEQHASKIVLINNNDELKTQDNINKKKLFKIIKTKDKKIEEEEKYFISQTNNHEIFEKYSEKIVDVKLSYNIDVENIVNILKKTNKDKDYIDWNLVCKLFNSLQDVNKKTNIRMMKTYIVYVEIAKELLEDSEILQIFKNEIYIKIFTHIVEEDKKKIDEIHLNQIQTKGLAKLFFEKLKESFSLDIGSLKESIAKETENIKKYEHDEQKQQEDKMYKEKIDKAYFDYLYGLSYKKEEFVKDMYRLLLCKKNIVYLVSPSTFSFYIETFLIELDTENKEKYKRLFLIKMKQYIKRNKQYLQKFFFDDNQFIDDEMKTELENYYHRLKSKDYTKEDQLDVKSLITTLMEKNGYNASQELALSNIPKDLHKKNFIEDREYFETVFKFMDWLNSFAGTKPFVSFYDMTIDIYKELYKEKEYKHKMGFVLNNFGINTNELEKEEENNDK